MARRDREDAHLKRISYPKAGFVLVMAVYGIVLARDVTTPRFFDRVDLIAHEAGHLLFSWFGEFLMVAGGTICQILVPAAVTAYFLLRKEYFSSAVSFFWIGQNLFNIAVYIRDAQAMALPLVSVGGGENSIHDWNYLLLKFGVLRWDQQIGNLVIGAGMLVMIASVAAGFHFSVERDPGDA